MSIKGIKISNFKGFGEKEQYIEFAPITMIFGQNSAGKSSIFDAFGLIYEILKTGQLSPKNTSHSKRELGGFDSYVHNKDISKDVTLGVVVDRTIKLTSWCEVFPEESTFYFSEQPKPQEPHTIKTAEIKLTFGYEEDMLNPSTKKYELILDGELFLSLTDGYLHFLCLDHPAIFGDYDSANGPFTDIFLRYTGFYEPAKAFEKQVYCGQYFRDFDFSSGFEWWIDDGEPEGHPYFEQFDEIYDGHIDEAKLEFSYLQQYINKINNAVLDAISDELENFIHIGPLRKIQPRQSIYSGQMRDDTYDWWDGSKAWEALHVPYDRENTLLEELNHWLSSPDKMASNYQIRSDALIRIDAKKLAEISQDSTRNKWFSELTRSANIDSSIAIIDTKTNTVLSQQEVGVGLSQLLPIMVAVLMISEYTSSGLLAVEQPELHIHPKLQIHLMDMIMDAHGGGSPTVLETHSEYMMLRVMKRLYDTHERLVEPNQTCLLGQDVAVYYVTNNDLGSEVKRLRLDDEGEFLDRWPEGFFPQRTEQLI